MDRPRRVAVTVEQCWHRVPGGTATSILGMLGALSGLDGLDLVGVSARHREPAPQGLEPPIPVRQMPLGRRLLYETWHGISWPSIEQVIGPVDVVHATAVAVPPCDAPLVMTIHDLAFLADPTQATRHGNRFFRRGTDLARSRAQLVLVPSEATAQECRDAGFDPDRLRVIPWGVDLSAPLEEGAAVGVRGSHGLTRPYVLFVGTVEPRKNLRRVLAAAADALAGREVDLVLVGPDGWNEDLGADLRRLSERGVRVHRPGFVPWTDLPALYSGAAAFVYPSLREGFGMPVLEAMANGAPVVTSLGTATAEVAGDAALLVEPTDVSAIAAAISRLLDDPALADRLRVEGRARAETFTWQRTAESTAAAYEEVAP